MKFQIQQRMLLTLRHNTGCKDQDHKQLDEEPPIQMQTGGEVTAINTNKLKSNKQAFYHTKVNDSTITGRKIMQPKLIVQNSEKIVEPVRSSPPKTQSKSTSKPKGAKKSKSQTIQAPTTQNFKINSNQQTKGFQPNRLIEFLDTSLIHQSHGMSKEITEQIQPDPQLTLKILNSSAENLSKYVKQRHHSSDRSKVQMKYLNFQRKNIQSKKESRLSRHQPQQFKQSATKLNQENPRNFKNLNKTQSTSAEKIPRFTGSLSPRSKTGCEISKLFVPDNQLRNQKSKPRQALTKSAVDITTGEISQIVLDKAEIIDSQNFTMQVGGNIRKQNNSLASRQNDMCSLFPVSKQKSSQNSVQQDNILKKNKSSISPERAQKINKLIRENIRKEIQAQESKRREVKEREESSQRRKKLIEQKNQIIRQLNNDKIQRRRIKLKENLTIFGEERDANETKLFEDALLAVQESANMLDVPEISNRLFDQQNSKKELIKGGLKTYQHCEKNGSQSRINQIMSELSSGNNQKGQVQHGRTQGMDFIDVRKEIASELKLLTGKQVLLKMSKKQIPGWTDSTLNLQTSKSQKQSFVPLKQQVHVTSISLNQPQTLTKPSQDKKGYTILSQIKNENMLFKREKIRKFMKEKARLIASKADQQKEEEIRFLKKMRCNLTKLNQFVQRKHFTSGISTPALKVKRQVKKNITVLCDNDQPKKSYPLRYLNNHQMIDRNITPLRTGIFEQSDTSFNISAQNKRGSNRSVFGQLTQKDFQRLHDTLYEDSRLSSIDTHDEQSGKRKEPVSKVLSVCFEKSASQKALRKSLRQSSSPQILRQQATSGKKGRISAPSLKLQRSSAKRKNKSAPKRSKSSMTKRLLPVRSKQRPKSLINKYDEQAKVDLNQLTLKLKMTDQAAALIIQKEVRRYLASLGFYEATMKNKQKQEESQRLLSPDRDSQNQISLYIQQRSHQSKRTSQKKQRSNSSSRKKHTSSSQKRKSSFDYELVDPKSSQKSSIQLQISPQKLRDLIRQDYTTQQQRQQNQKDHELSLIDSVSHLQNSNKTRIQEEKIISGQKKPLDGGRTQQSEKNQELKSQISKPVDIPPLWDERSPRVKDQHNQIGADAASQSSSSLFDRNTFQKFSQQHLANIMKNNEYQQLIQFREECLMFRERKEKQLINKLFLNNQITPKTFKQRQQNIEKWVTLQRKEIEQTKQGFQEEWDKTIQMIEETQKNVDLTRQKINQALNNGDTNSYSQGSSRQNALKIPSRILIDEAPRSYRSSRHDSAIKMNLDADPSQGVITSRGGGDSALPTDEKNQTDGLAALLQLGKQKSRSEKLEQNSKSVSTTNLKNKEKQEQDLIVKQQSQKNEKRMIDFDILDSHQKSNSGGGYFDQFTDNQPSAEFIDRLEKATKGLLYKDSVEGTLNIEEHEYDENLVDSNVPQDNILSDKHLKHLNKLFSADSQANSDSDHKSEPMLFDNGDIQQNSDLNQISIQNLIRKNKTILPLNEQNDDEFGPTEIVKTVLTNQPASELKNLLNEQMTDQVTETILQWLIKDCLVIPQRKKRTSGIKSPPVPETEVFTVETYSAEKEEKKEWIEMRQRYLIDSNLIRADAYVNELVDVLLQFDISDISEDSEFDYEIKPTDNFHIQFLKRLTQPIIRAPIETLELMQKSELGTYTHFETTLDASKCPIVSVDLYLDVEKQREENMLVRQRNVDARQKQIFESIHIFNKCIFDSVNESLMKFRPYGLVGQPMPWSNKIRRLQTKVEIASVDTERLFQMVKQEIFRWSSVFCGCLPGSVFYFPNPRTGKDEFQEDLFQEVREKRLTTILSQDTLEQEHHWLNYEFEESQCKIDLSDMILESLVSELVEFLNRQNQV